MVEYELSGTVQQLIDSMIGNPALSEFSPLREYDVKVIGFEKFKINKDEELVKAGAVFDMKKVSPLQKILIQGDYLLSFDRYSWTNFTQDERSASIHLALMGIDIKTNTDGDVKYGAKRPDLVLHTATIVRFGVTIPEISRARDLITGAGTAAGRALTAAHSRQSSELIDPDEET